MREEDIQRYGRQILLKELGGRGQQKLLSRHVEAHGDGPGLRDALTYLQVGGTPLAGTGVPVLLIADAPVPATGDVVVLGQGVAWRRADACEACWALTHPRLSPTKDESVTLGSLAALTVQRLVLGWGDALGLVLHDGARLETVTPPRCEQHR